MLDWPDDVVEVADGLGIEHFAIEGLSGGGPYALACTYKIPQRLTGCSLIVPATGPFLREAGPLGVRVAIWMLLHIPWPILALIRLSTRLTGSDEASIEKTLVRNAARLGAADQKLLDIPEIRHEASCYIIYKRIRKKKSASKQPVTNKQRSKKRSSSQQIST